MCVCVRKARPARGPMAATPAARPLAPPTSRPPRLAPREWPSAANTRASGGGFFFFFFLPVGRGGLSNAPPNNTHKKTQPPRGLGAGRGSWPAATRRAARCARGHAPGPSLGKQTLPNGLEPRKYRPGNIPVADFFSRALGAAGRGRVGGGRGRGAPHAARPREVRPRPASRRLDRDCARGVRPRRASPRRVRSADRGWGAAAWPWRVCFAPAERAAAQGSGRTPRDRAGSASGARRSERRAERGVA